MCLLIMPGVQGFVHPTRPLDEAKVGLRTSAMVASKLTGSTSSTRLKHLTTTLTQGPGPHKVFLCASLYTLSTPCLALAKQTMSSHLASRGKSYLKRLHECETSGDSAAARGWAGRLGSDLPSGPSFGCKTGGFTCTLATGRARRMLSLLSTKSLDASSTAQSNISSATSARASAASPGDTSPNNLFDGTHQ